MKARRVVSKGQTLQQVRYTPPAQPSSSASHPEIESQSLFALNSSSLAATVLHRHPLGKLVRLRETYAGSNVEPAATIARRIRSALDLLANEQWKRCTQECDKLLKKHPGFLCATILRSMALFRTSPEHAVELVRSENDQPPIIDPLTLMCYVYFWMYQAQDAKVVVKTISEYLNNKACFKDSDTYSAIMFVYLRYGMYKHFQQIAWTMHSQERSNRSFKSVLLSLLLMVEVCDTSGPDVIGVMPIAGSSSIISDNNVGTAKLDAKNRSVESVSRLGAKFMEKKIEDEKLLLNPNAAGPLIDTYLIFLNKCSNFKGMLELVDRMLSATPVQTSAADSEKSIHDRLHAIKYGFARAEVFKLMERYAEALGQYKKTMLSVCEHINETSSVRRTAASFIPHEAKESIAECIYNLYNNALSTNNQNDSIPSESVEEITALCEAVVDAVSQHHAKNADNIMTKAKIISHLLALIEVHHGSAKLPAKGGNSTDFHTFYAAIPFISRDAVMQCVQDMYRLTPRDSPAFYDCAKHLMRFFDDHRLYEQWKCFVAVTSGAENDESLLLNPRNGTSITADNENDVLNGRTAAWYRQISVKIVVDEFLNNVIRDADEKHRNTKVDDSLRENRELNGDGISGDNADEVLGQVETLLRLFVRARAGEASDEGTGPPHNSEDFGVLAVIKLYRHALAKGDNSLLWLCTLIVAEFAKSITLQHAVVQNDENSSAQPKLFKLVDSTQILFQFLLMNIMMRFGAMPAALEIFQSGMQVKNLQIHRFGYYLSAAATFLMPGPSGMFVSSHLCEYISLSVTEANRFVEQAIQSGNVHESIGDVLECAHHLPSLQNSLLGRSLTLHTIWQLFFMQIPQALGPCGILKRFEAYKEDLSNCLLTEVNYRNELTALNTVPAYDVDDVSDDAKRQFLQVLLRDQTIFGQLFDLFAAAFSMAFYMRQNSIDDAGRHSEVAENGEEKRKNVNAATVDSSAVPSSSASSTSSGGVTQAQLIRERVHVAFYDDMREQLMQRLGELPEPATKDMPESVEYFEKHLTFPYSDPLAMVHSMGVFSAFIHACDIAKSLRGVLLHADIIVTSSQLASRLGNDNTTAEATADSAELKSVIDELQAIVRKTIDQYNACLNNWSQRHADVLTSVADGESDSNNLAKVSKMSPFWFRHFVEEVAGVVWLVQALRLFGHRYSTVLRVSANPIKAMLMAHPSSNDIVAGGDVVAAAATAPAGLVQQLLGATAQKQQASKPQSGAGRRGGGGAKQRAQQQNRAGTTASSGSTIQTSYSTLENLLAPAIDTLGAFVDKVESGAQQLLQIFNRIPFLGENAQTTPFATSLFGEPEFQSAEEFFPAEWERFRFVFAVSASEAKDLHESTRRRILASWTKTMDELISVLRDKGAPINGESSGRAAAQYQEMQASWL